MAGKYDLTDAQWRSIAQLARGKLGDRGRTGSSPRDFVNGVLWIMFYDRQWSDLPARFGKWRVAHQRFVRWRAKGVWDDIFTILTASKSNMELAWEPSSPKKVDYIGLYRGGLKNKQRSGKKLVRHHCSPSKPLSDR